jgi:hypothetical protein
MATSVLIEMRDWGCGSVTEHSPGLREALSSILSIAGKQERKEGRKEGMKG